jgi:hypothetical protein
MPVILRAFACGIFLAASACSPWFWGGAAAGALGTGAAYERERHEELEELERDYERGRIDREEYRERKHELEETSPFE